MASVAKSQAFMPQSSRPRRKANALKLALPSEPPAQEQDESSDDNTHSTKPSTSSRKARTSLGEIPSDKLGSPREQKKFRNRTSAVRHRRRKKEMEDDLEQKQRELVERNESINKSIDEMKSLRLQIRGLLMSHSMCGFAPIDQYHLHSAQSVSVDGGLSSASAASQAANQIASGAHPQLMSPIAHDRTGFCPTSATERANSHSNSSCVASHPRMSSSDTKQSDDWSESVESPIMSDSGAICSTPTHHDGSVNRGSLNVQASPYLNPRDYRALSNGSSCSGYQMFNATDFQSAVASPDTPALDDSEQSQRTLSVGGSSDDSWNLPYVTQSTFTSTQTTPDKGTFQEAHPEYLGQSFLHNPSSLDDMCCNLEAVMNKSSAYPQVTDEDFLDSFFTDGLE